MRVMHVSSMDGFVCPGSFRLVLKSRGFGSSVGGLLGKPEVLTCLREERASQTIYARGFPSFPFDVPSSRVLCVCVCVCVGVS